ncbi:MAG: hypothetical protein AB1Z98_26930 [Nannocystaceae bacterium]
MVGGRIILGAGLGGLVLGALLGAVSCKVLVEDNCANQPVPGNEFCRERYGNAASFCSPCRRELNGCVQNPPFSCPGYYDEVEEEDGGSGSGESTEGDASGTTGATGMASGTGAG